MTVWFTSDTHFGHSNVIEYSNRPYKSVEEMDEALIQNWNECVKPGDLIYHLGDFALSKTRAAVNIPARLNGQKYLVWGNHDKNLRKEKMFAGHWIWQKDLAEITVADQKIVLCHFAMLTWNKSHHGSWQLHGHSHGTLPVDQHSLRMDVGVDPCGMRPISFEEVREVMLKRDFRPVDHHGGRDHEQ
jgi:calcineurin-like phosphoesterase family protein